MSYQRVIPRDLFNEANLLKCLGRFYIVTERFQPIVTMDHDGEAFDIQMDDSGNLSVANVALIFNDAKYTAFRPINSRAPWPLFIEIEYDWVAVFTDEGELSAEIMALIESAKGVSL